MLSTMVNVGCKSVRKAVRERQKILSGGEKELALSTAISQENHHFVFTYWTYEASRPTGDKKIF